VAELTIAVDGPASSGKGTVARAVARALGYAYVDTGAMYRVVGLLVSRAGLSTDDGAACGRVASTTAIRFGWDGDRLRVWSGDEEVTDAIRTGPVGLAASAVARHPEVRAALLGAQRALGAAGGVVMDGRDIGTVVLPDAQVKIYLDASLDERARRRQRELPHVTFERVRADLAARDSQDAGRAAAPLRQAEDAHRIDSTGRTVESVVEEIVALAGRG
jgi:cytidylate kinase